MKYFHVCLKTYELSLYAKYQHLLLRTCLLITICSVKLAVYYTVQKQVRDKGSPWKLISGLLHRKWVVKREGNNEEIFQEFRVALATKGEPNCKVICISPVEWYREKSSLWNKLAGGWGWLCHGGAERSMLMHFFPEYDLVVTPMGLMPQVGNEAYAIGLIMKPSLTSLVSRWSTESGLFMADWRVLFFACKRWMVY